jgi:hypothetical protein
MNFNKNVEQSADELIKVFLSAAIERHVERRAIKSAELMMEYLIEIDPKVVAYEEIRKILKRRYANYEKGDI